MIEFIVEGASLATGEDLKWKILAESQKQVEEVARSRGMLVSRVTSLTDPWGNAARIERDNAETGFARAENALRSHPTKATVDSGNEGYRGLVVGGAVLRTLAYIYYFISLITLLGSVIALLTSTDPRVQSSQSMALTLLIYASASVVAGAIQHALGEGCFALRDIALVAKQVSRLVSAGSLTLKS